MKLQIFDMKSKIYKWRCFYDNRKINRLNWRKTKLNTKEKQNHWRYQIIINIILMRM